MESKKFRQEHATPYKKDTISEDDSHAYKRTAISASVIYKAISREGERELRRPSLALGWSGLAAGLSMGFSIVAEAVLLSGLPVGIASQLFAKLGFSVGFIIVTIGRQQLFTENTVTAVIPFLHSYDKKHFLMLAKLWGIVLIANLIGAFLFAFITGLAPIATGFQAKFIEIAKPEVAFSFSDTLFGATIAGWLVALMVWLLPGAGNSRIFIIVMITFIVRAARLTHIISGSVVTLFLVIKGIIPFSTYLTAFMVPTLIGNIIGGVVFVTLINHAQVVTGSK